MKVVGVTGQDNMTHLFDVEEPSPERNEVVVEVMAASMNDFDRTAVRGGYTSVMGQQDPVTLGRDFVGLVTAVGDDVNYIDVGMYVAGALTPTVDQPGTFADKVAVPAASLAAVPDGIDLAEAAGVGLAGVSALDTISTLGPAHLGRLLIHGPVGEVGGFALQFAKAHGAVVVVITRQEQVELAWALGADYVLSEDANPSQSIEAVRRFFHGGADTAIHVAGDILVTAGVLRPGGKFTSVDGVTAAVPSDDGYVPTIVAPRGHKLADLLFKVASQRLISPVGRTLSFDQIGDAVNLGESDRGRTIVVR
jgi:NADPH:quinone reductase-like Zn-dependent oxidoreductase